MRQPAQLRLSLQYGRRRRSRGTGLFDALIALVILSFGVLGIVRFQGRMVAQSTEAQSRQLAVQLGDEVLSTVLVDVGNAACYELPRTPAPCASPAAEMRTANWAAEVAAALPPPVTAATTRDGAGERMTVTITWRGKHSGDIHTMEAVTDVRP